MFQVVLGRGSVLGHNNNMLSSKYSYSSLIGLNNGPLSLHYTNVALLLWQYIYIYKYCISPKKYLMKITSKPFIIWTYFRLFCSFWKKTSTFTLGFLAIAWLKLHQNQSFEYPQVYSTPFPVILGVNIWYKD